MAEVNGNLIYQAKQYIIDNYGLDRFRSLLDHLDPEMKDSLHKAIFSDQWYDVKRYQALLEAITREFGQGELKKIAEYSLERQIKGFFGIFVKLFTPERILSLTDRMWSKTYRGGKCKGYKQGERYVVEVSSFDFNDAQRYGFMYYVETLIKKTHDTEVVSSFNIDNDTTYFFFTVLAKG